MVCSGYGSVGSYAFSKVNEVLGCLSSGETYEVEVGFINLLFSEASTNVVVLTFSGVLRQGQEVMQPFVSVGCSQAVYFFFPTVFHGLLGFLLG